LKEVDASLSRLQCDVIDLYQCHWPDPDVLIERTMEILFKLQGSGKIRHIGMCNADISLLERARRVAPVSTLQMQYSLLQQEAEKEILPYCLEHGIGFIAYGALGGGILTGKYRSYPQFGKQDARKRFYRFFEGDAFGHAYRVAQMLESFGHPSSQSALNWVRGKKGVLTVLAGARTHLQLKENAGAAGWSLSEREYALCGQTSAEGV
jgi:aryl-alcohol dehydrogenase-like predicted oxidoreductase